MKIDQKTVEHVAELANLKLDATQSAQFSQQLSGILDYIDQLNAVETAGVETTFNVSSNQTVMSEDVVAKSLTQAEALANATNSHDGSFVTKGVFEDE